MAEWSKATVLKTVVSQDTQGSNPCFSAIFFIKKQYILMNIFVPYIGFEWRVQL